LFTKNVKIFEKFRTKVCIFLKNVIQ